MATANPTEADSRMELAPAIDKKTIEADRQAKSDRFAKKATPKGQDYHFRADSYDIDGYGFDIESFLHLPSTATRATLTYGKYKGVKGGNTQIDVINATCL